MTPFASLPGEYRRLDRYLVREIPILEPADVRILAFGVFTHHNEVDVVRFDVLERRSYAWQQDRRPDARVLIESTSNRQEQTVERYVVLHLGMPDRAEEYGVESTQLLHAVGGHHLAVLEVVLGTPRELDEFPLDVVLARESVQNLQRFVDDIDADAVALDYRDAVLTHS